MAKSNEPILWLLFSVGGMISAMLFPPLIIITGIIVPFGLEGETTYLFEKIHFLVKTPLVKLLLFFVIALPFFHWAHRFRFTLVDIGLKPISFLISTLCYGGAVAGSLLTLYTLLRI